MRNSLDYDMELMNININMTIIYSTKYKEQNLFLNIYIEFMLLCFAHAYHTYILYIFI